MPDITLTETISVSTRDITEEEKYLARQINALYGDCIRWARKQMEYGSHSTRLALTKSMLTSASRLAALDTKTQTETHRAAFQALLSEMTAINATSTPALTEPTDDQDETS